MNRVILRIAAAMAAVAALVVAPAFGQASGKAPIKMTWLTMVGGETYNFTEGVIHNEIFDEIARRTGVTWDFSPCIGANDYNQRIGLLLASGEIPDIIMARDGVSLDKILKAGVALEIDDLVKKHAPNIMKYGKKALAVMKLQRSDGTGKLYGIPEAISLGAQVNQLYPQGFYLRWDLYKKLGMPRLATEDDYLKVLADMLKLEPVNKDGKKNYGFGFDLKWPGAHMQLGDYPFEPLAGIYFGTWENNVDIRNEWKFIPRIAENNAFTRQMRFMNKAWRMGLIDPESITQDGAILDQKFKECRYMAQTTWGDKVPQSDQAFIDGGEPQKGFAPVIVESLTSKDYLDMGNLLTAGGSTTTIITKACKDPVRAIQMLDFLMSPEGAVLQKFGIEGKHWDIKNGKGIVRQEVIDGFKSDPDYWKKSGLNLNGRFANISFLMPDGLKIKGNVDAGFDLSDDFISRSLNEVQKDYLAAYKIKTPHELYSRRAKVIFWDPWACNIMLLPDEVAEKENKMVAYLDTMVPSVVFSRTEADFNSGLKKMLSELKAMGWDQFSEIHAKDFAAAQAGFKKYYDQLGK
jgi:putative aldouronate transport system substrate-binding protein